MDILNLLGTTLGLGLAAGLRLYATVLALGVALRMEWLTLPSELAPLQVLAHPAVLAVAGVMYVMEFVTDKVPWLDSAWDAAHTVIRPLGAAGLALTAFGQMDPAARVGLALLCGGGVEQSRDEGGDAAGGEPESGAGVERGVELDGGRGGAGVCVVHDGESGGDAGGERGGFGGDFLGFDADGAIVAERVGGVAAAVERGLRGGL